MYNASGRGVPDVSAVGENFMIVNSGVAEGVDGTSCSTPTFAGMVALINDARVAARKRPLGFLNQLLYSNPKVFTDVVMGNNPGCGSTGFEAAVGWDPITGLGAPRFQDLLKMFLLRFRPWPNKGFVKLPF
jgi:tripeptidyl-peptidase-1